MSMLKLQSPKTAERRWRRGRRKELADRKVRRGSQHMRAEYQRRFYTTHRRTHGRRFYDECLDIAVCNERNVINHWYFKGE